MAGRSRGSETGDVGPESGSESGDVGPGDPDRAVSTANLAGSLGTLIRGKGPQSTKVQGNFKKMNDRGPVIAVL